MSKQLWERDQLRKNPIMFDRKGRVVEGGSPMLKSNCMIMIKPTGSRRKNDFPALDIRENQRNASTNLFGTDNDDINLHAPTAVQYGNEPEKNKLKPK